ncbi:MAG: hypothetical protein RR910_08400 [Acidaminococcaceae bacterium]
MADFITLNDYAARFGTQGEVAYKTIIEMQSKTNAVLQVLPFHPCNSGFIDKAVIRTSLPEVAWRLINKGVPYSKSASKQVSFTCGTMEALAQIDEELVDINGNSAEWRLSENAAFQEAMNQEWATTFFYGDEKVTPAKFTGLSAYYYAKGQDSIYSDRIIDCGGTGNNLTSLWITCMGPQTMYGIFPDKTKAGFSYEDKGKQKITDNNGNSFYAYESQYKWRSGLVLKDPRYVVRLANIDMTKLTTSDADTFIDKLITGYNRIENPMMGKMSIFCNRDLETYLWIMSKKSTNVRLSLDDFGGRKVTHFVGAPILRCDAILNTESAIS